MESVKDIICKKIINKQSIYMNNCKKSIITDEKMIWNNMFSGDEMIENKIYNLINNPYQKKINLMNLILESNITFPIKNNKDIIKFFNWTSPLNIEFNLASNKWNYSSIKYANKSKLLVQNSISKLDINNYFYLNYIDKIKKIFLNSKVKYYYFEFKSKRFNKIKDLIFVFDNCV